MADQPKPDFDPYPVLPSKEEAQATPKPIRWLVQRKREDSFELAWPFEADGKEYRSLTVRRLTADEVGKFIERLRATEGTLRFPIWRDERGDLLPDDIWAAMDDDDIATAERMQLDFLPARFTSAVETEPPNTTSDRPTGDTGGSSSAEKPDSAPSS